ncbi:hypothetical protein KEM55_008128, partial [Ascosphaera atra]
PYNERSGALDTPEPLPILIEGREKWEVEAILDHKKWHGKLLYPVKWKDFRDEDSSWEPESKLANVQDALQAYKASHEITTAPRRSARRMRLTAGKAQYSSPTPSSHPLSSRQLEPHANVAHVCILDGYEHLDPLWAVDACDRVGTHIRDVVWREAMKALEEEGDTGGANPLTKSIVVPKGVRMDGSIGVARVATTSDRAAVMRAN